MKTRDELKALGYPAKGKGHGDGTYLLFKIAKTNAPANASAALAASVESVIVRTKDFARTPTVRKQLKDFLESADRNDKGLSGQHSTFTDPFAGIGWFHLAMHRLGKESLQDSFRRCA